MYKRQVHRVGRTFKLQLLAVQLNILHQGVVNGVVGNRVNAEDIVGLAILEHDLDLLAQQGGVVLGNLGEVDQVAVEMCIRDRIDTAYIKTVDVAKVTYVASSQIIAGSKTYKFSEDTIDEDVEKDDWVIITKNLYNDNNDIVVASKATGTVCLLYTSRCV